MSSESKCRFCCKTDAKYSCPKCNSGYCSLKCYQSTGHLECSESFYKECVENEMALASSGDKESMKRTYEMLVKMKEDDEQSDDNLDSDDDDELADRLEGINLDDADEVWKRLTPAERSEFQRMCSNGEIEGLVPKYVPWWEEDLDQKPLIQEADSCENPTNPQPAIDLSNIPKMKDILGDKLPSPLMKFSVLNALYGYAYSMRFYQGCDEPAKFVSLCLVVSESLGMAKIFDSAEMAVETAASKANQDPSISLGVSTCRSIKNDVLRLVKGPGKGRPNNTFVLSAFSHLKQIFHDSLKAHKTNKGSKTHLSFCPPEAADIHIDVKQIKLVSKKIDFYLSWSNEYYKEFELFYQM